MMTTKTAKIHAQRRRAATAVARELSKRGRRDLPRNEMEKDKKNKEQWQLYQQIGRILSSSLNERDVTKESVTPEAGNAVVF